MKVLHRLTALSAVLVCGALMAQESVGSVVGSVHDKGGAAIAGATVTITSPNLLSQRTIRTNEKGEFRIPLLLPGDYTLVITKDQYTSSKGVFRLGAGQIMRQDAVLAPVQTESAIVEVLAISAAVDKTETKTATNLSLETLQGLPLGLNSYAAIALSPGVVPGNGSVAYPVVRGGLIGETQFTVNGISVRDNVVRQGRQFEAVIDDLTQDISVIQSPLNAKYGNVSGGIVNLVTKTGTNTFEGTLRVKLSKSSWTAGNPKVLGRDGVTAARVATVPQSDDLARTYEVTLLGPIVKDHLTFAYAARFAPATTGLTQLTNLASLGFTGLPGFGPTAGNTYGATAGNDVVVQGPQVANTQQLKLFWQLTSNHQIEFFYTKDELGPFFDTQSGNVDSFATFKQSSKRPFYGINYRGLIGASGVLDVKYGKKKSEVNFSSGPFDPINVRVWTPTAATIFSTAGTGGTVLTNGDTARPSPELRQTETFSANFNKFWGDHQFDFGAEMLKETSFLPDQSGPNRQLFYAPGRNIDGRYLVFNYTGSPADVTSGTALSRTLSNSNAFVPELRSFSDTPGGDPKNFDQTRSLYANDLWTLNSHWSVMMGLRWDNWKVDDRSGNRVDTSSLSPRLEAKYDLDGNNRHLFNLSYAQFRGTIGQGNLGGLFARRPGNRQVRNFYNQGSTTPYLVDQATFLNPANYGRVYAFSDNDGLFDINKSLKPEVAHEITLGYKRAFESGGSFRATAVYRKYKDLWYREGINEVVSIPDFTGTGLPANSGVKSILTIDPRGRRDYRGLELEFSHPILTRSNYALDFNGNWTLSRTYGTTTWRDGNVASSAATYYGLMDAAGYSMDSYNPYGELPISFHNVVRGWVTYRIGSPKGTNSVLSLLGRFQSGAPYSVAVTQAPPSTLVAAPGQLTSVPEFFNGRGGFSSPDTYQFDLQWNVTIPIKGKVEFFSFLSINNLFNSQMPNALTRNAASALRPYPDPNPTSASVPGNNFGVTSAFTGARSVNIDLGLRF